MVEKKIKTRFAFKPLSKQDLTFIQKTDWPDQSIFARVVNIVEVYTTLKHYVMLLHYK